MAKVEYQGATKKSRPLEIVPPPKVVVDFRPKSNWNAEFGFDWLRMDDTSIFGDNKYEDIISKQYTDSTYTTLEKNQNKYKGKFKKDTKQFEDLKEKYGTFEIPWRTVTDASGNKVKDKHVVQWLALKNGKTAELKLILDIEEKADYLEFEDNEHFEITPKKIDISGKGKGQNKKLSDPISIKCKKEFTTDQEIIVKAYLNSDPTKGIQAGKIMAWANDATKQKQKKVVFVQIQTDILGAGVPNTVNANAEKDRINTYLKQAFIELHPDSKIVDLDLTTDTDFSRFVKNGALLTISKLVPAQPATKTTPPKPAIPREKLIDYLKKKLKAIDNNKYAKFFKAFYFAEHGYHSDGNLSGYSAENADYVVVFKSANDQTAVHELLHAFNLTHTFANSEASANAEFTYEYKKTDNLLDYSHHISGHKNDRRSLWYWQWIKANKSI